MKKIVYSVFLKFIAVVLVIACAAIGAGIVAEVFSEFENSGSDIVYRLESDFSKSHMFYPYYYDVQCAVLNAYRTEYLGENEQNTDVSVISNDTHASAYNTVVAYDAPDGFDGYGNEEASVNNVLIDNVVIQRDMNKTPPVILQLFSDKELRTGKILACVSKELNSIKELENTEWYIYINGESITNSTPERIAMLMKGDAYSFRFSRDGLGNSDFESMGSEFRDIHMLDEISSFNTTDSISVFVAVKEGHIKEMQALWNEQENTVREAFLRIISLAVIALLILIYLVCAAGKSADGELSSVWIDRVWTELHILLPVASVAGAAAVLAVTAEMYVYNNGIPMYMLRGISMLVFSAAMTLVTVSLLSLVRKIKCGLFLKTSLLGIVAVGIFKAVRYFFCALRKVRNSLFYALSRKTAALFGVWLLLYTGVIGFCGVLIHESAAFLVIAVTLFLAELFLLAWRARDLEEIKKGIGEVYNGNYSYNVPEIKSSDLKETASYINEISRSIDCTVAEKTKAERMKTELVTNISHDIKTPLTSIISYTGLLSDMKGLPDEARDYISIIAAKSDRLKKLTSDLFDISKVHSGNERAELETLNLSLLVEQAMAELDDDIKTSELEFCTDIAKDMHILADGKKMSRVMGNLLGNILKYFMKKTRVYICAYEKDGKNVLELKNISAFPLDFDPNEITGRFVRGDLSRTTEGNGLGLAIAKGYTEVCGGSFEVITDGDLFKAVMSFEKVLPQG
ncbi:MAG: HAMP domain-containing histidine kinase [Clostridia bacterium]|nr:HAMP domain-containing histidine kinase [Clostridia bacterium]